MDEIASGEVRVRQAVFLVGGEGTRLGELTRHAPKPLLEVAGQPFLDTLIENVARYGIRDIVLLAGYLGDQVVARYENWGRERNLTIRCVVEPIKAGTGGALRYAADLLDKQFFLCNGDSLFDVNVLDLTQIEPAVARLALRGVSDASRYGQVVLRGDRIERILERGKAGPGLINGGIYLLQKEILNQIPARPCSIEADIFPALIQQRQLSGRKYSGFFIDIGIPADFTRAQEAVPANLRRPAAFFDRDGVLNRDFGYVSRMEKFEWIDGAITAIKRLNDRGWYVFVITNQAGVARGYYDEYTVRALHAWMADKLAARGAHVDAFYYCPHHPEASVTAYRMVCDCRKPAPGMLKAAIAQWQVDVGASFLIGDKPSDMAAAEAAGIAGHPFAGGNLSELVDELIGRAVSPSGF